MLEPNKTPIWFGKLINYEYWPIWLFYIPVGLYVAYLALRARSVTFFTGVNPSIKDSGILRYSKFGVLESIPESLKPKGILVNKNKKIASIPAFLCYPVIAKPDMGERGKGVQILHDDDELLRYANSLGQDFILQEFCDFPYEAGIFYVRMPSESQGTVTSFTTKEFLHVVGDGVNTIENLMVQTFRAKLQIKRQKQDFLSSVPKKGESIRIEAIGNHNRGTKFINSNHLITPELTKTFDSIAHKIEGFYYGRFDLKYKSLETLQNGESIKIMELNGINSEPTHIYDQSTGLIKAYRDFFTHIRYMYEISGINKEIGVKRSPAFAFWKDIFFG